MWINFTYRYINDVLSINNSRFAEYLPLIYPPELEVKETTDGPCIANQLRDVNTICRRSWYIAAHIWKIYEFPESFIKTIYYNPWSVCSSCLLNEIFSMCI
jgi:hypothetical protein